MVHFFCIVFFLARLVAFHSFANKFSFSSKACVCGLQVSSSLSMDLQRFLNFWFFDFFWCFLPFFADLFFFFTYFRSNYHCLTLGLSCSQPRWCSLTEIGRIHEKCSRLKIAVTRKSASSWLAVSVSNHMAKKKCHVGRSWKDFPIGSKIAFGKNSQLPLRWQRGSGRSRLLWSHPTGAGNLSESEVLFMTEIGLFIFIVAEIVSVMFIVCLLLIINYICCTVVYIVISL